MFHVKKLLYIRIFNISAWPRVIVGMRFVSNKQLTEFSEIFTVCRTVHLCSLWRSLDRRRDYIQACVWLIPLLWMATSQFWIYAIWNLEYHSGIYLSLTKRVNKNWLFVLAIVHFIKPLPTKAILLQKRMVIVGWMAYVQHFPVNGRRRRAFRQKIIFLASLAVNFWER